MFGSSVRITFRCSDRPYGTIYSVLLASSSLAVNCYFPLIKIGVSLEPIKSTLWIDLVNRAVRSYSTTATYSTVIFNIGRFGHFRSKQTKRAKAYPIGEFKDHKMISEYPMTPTRYITVDTFRSSSVINICKQQQKIKT